MKVVLCCAEYTIDKKRNRKYWKEIKDDYYLETELKIVLPVETIVTLEDDEFGYVEFKVIEIWYDHSNNLIYLNLDIYGGDMSPKEFVQYLKKHWTFKPLDL